MKLEIVKMADPADPTNKTARPCLLWGTPQFFEGEFWQLVIPMTSNCKVQKGHVLLSDKSPAFASTGLTNSCCIEIADTFRYRTHCETVEGVKRTGHFLSPLKDKKLLAQFGFASMEAAQALGDFKRLPIAF